MLGVLVFPRATSDLVRAHVPTDALVVAVDAGAEALLAAGRVPSAVVGDMDSARAQTLAELEKRGARIERHAADKRDTDAALALAHLRGCREVLFVGAGGGRMDHALANLHLLAEVSTWAQVRAVDVDHETWVVTPEHPLTMHLPKGATVSAIPFDPVVEGITYEGLAYRLSGAQMRAGDPYGLSNVALDPPQRIRVLRGRLFVIRPTQGIS